MAGFSEDTRVKIPALTHLTRIGYTYRSLHGLHLDPETNIDKETFARKLHQFNPELTDNDINLFIGKIRVMLSNEDLGREFYEKILTNKTYTVIDGTPIYMNGIKTIDVSHAREIVLATDGYPFLKPTLAESEAALRELLRQDPMLVTLYQATKGFMQGNCSFDDRAYLRVKIEENE